MTKDEQIYALFVEANPFSDLERLQDTPRSDHGGAGGHLQVVGADVPRADEPVARRQTIRGLSLAAAFLVLVGFGALLLRDAVTQDVSVGTSPQIAQVHEFIDRIDNGDVDGAVELLENPLGAIYFPAIDEVTSTAQVADYLEFYVAIGGHTSLSDCTAEPSGPGMVVTCQADQQVDALVPIGLEFAAFPMTFEVWNAGIRRISWAASSRAGITDTFFSSRFFEFVDLYMKPNDLVQDSGAPVWSKANGELMTELVGEFLGERP